MAEIRPKYLAVDVHTVEGGTEGSVAPQQYKQNTLLCFHSNDITFVLLKVTQAAQQYKQNALLRLYGNNARQQRHNALLQVRYPTSTKNILTHAPGPHCDYNFVRISDFLMRATCPADHTILDLTIQTLLV